MPRPRKPTALKKLQGKPGHHPLPENEPEPEIDVDAPPEPPPELDGDLVARKRWVEVAAMLHPLGLLTTIDPVHFVLRGTRLCRRRMEAPRIRVRRA